MLGSFWDTISTLRVKYIYIESNVHITFLGDNDRFQIWNVGIKLIYIFLIFIYDKIQICNKGKLLSLRDGRVWTNLWDLLFL